jgi:hypothetical protein
LPAGSTGDKVGVSQGMHRGGVLAALSPYARGPRPQRCPPAYPFARWAPLAHGGLACGPELPSYAARARAAARRRASSRRRRRRRVVPTGTTRRRRGRGRGRHGPPPCPHPAAAATAAPLPAAGRPAAAVGSASASPAPRCRRPGRRKEALMRSADVARQFGGTKCAPPRGAVHGRAARPRGAARPRAQAARGRGVLRRGRARQPRPGALPPRARRGWGSLAMHSQCASKQPAGAARALARQRDGACLLHESQRMPQRELQRMTKRVWPRAQGMPCHQGAQPGRARHR